SVRLPLGALSPRPSPSAGPAPSVPHPLSLHDALPICVPTVGLPLRPASRFDSLWSDLQAFEPISDNPQPAADQLATIIYTSGTRSEEHTSELQSRENLVCRLLLENKKPRRSARCQSVR